MDTEKVRREAKALMDDFMAALNTAEDVKEDIGIERKASLREPGKCKPDEDFTERMLGNAPKKKDRHIVAEKKKW